VGATVYGKIAAGAALEPLRRRPDTPPDTHMWRDGVEIDRRHLAAYDRVCGFSLSDTLPPTYPHVLAFPLAMELMAARDFPFGVLGLVHVGNAIEQLRPLRADERLDLLVWSERLADHPRGRTIDLVAEASVGGEPAWRDRSTYLHKGTVPRGAAQAQPEARGTVPIPGAESGTVPPGAAQAPSRARGTVPPDPHAVWDVPGDVGRRYASVSGDRNPIHLHGLSARLFGQPGAIAHGMWSKARCLAALQGHLPEAFAVEVSFKLPVRLPAKVAFSSRQDGGERRFALHDARSGKPHLEGMLSPSS
jgi:acyl dehydratase